MISDLFQNKKYIAAVSFGPDSMAMLDQLLSAGIRPIVCHVNYHRRPESNLEQSGLEQFCMARDLELNVLDTEGFVPKGNFQAWARETRYRFFKRIYEAEHADGLLVAHQEDDVIETYLFQKARKTAVLWYGISSENTAYGMTIIRPLLNKTKRELLDYCVHNRVPYAIDSSNLSDHYARNKIRHQIVEKLSPPERAALLSEMRLSNETNQRLVHQFEEQTSHFSSVTASWVSALPPGSFALFFYAWLRHVGLGLSVSRGAMENLHHLFTGGKPNFDYPLGPQCLVTRAYSEVSLRLGKTEDPPYRFQIDRPGILRTRYFDVDFSTGYLAEHIPSAVYPLTIRPARQGDRWIVGQYLKRVNRLYIDWKMPLPYRRIWPVVVDSAETIVYIPRFDPTRKKPPQSTFVIHKLFE